MATMFDSMTEPIPDRVTFYQRTFTGDAGEGVVPANTVDFSCFAGAGIRGEPRVKPTNQKTGLLRLPGLITDHAPSGCGACGAGDYIVAFKLPR